MALYEHIYLARQDVTPQQVETMTEQFKTVIEANGGSIAKLEYWGVKTLAYRIKKNRKGHYSLLSIDAPAPIVKEMERQLSLNEDVLRYMTVRVDELDLELAGLDRLADQRGAKKRVEDLREERDHVKAHRRRVPRGARWPGRRPRPEQLP